MRTLANLTIINSKGEIYRDTECLILAGVKIYSLRKSRSTLRSGASNRIGDQKEQVVTDPHSKRER